MPSWKKIIQSGSDAHLSNVTASGTIEATSGSFGIITGSLDISNLSQVASDIAPSKDDVLKFNGSEFVSVPEGTTFEFSFSSFAVNNYNSTTQLIGNSSNTWPSASSISYTIGYNNGPPTVESFIGIQESSTVTSGFEYTTNLSNSGNTGTANESNLITYPTSTNGYLMFLAKADGIFSTDSVANKGLGTSAGRVIIYFRNLFMMGGITSTISPNQTRIDTLLTDAHSNGFVSITNSEFQTNKTVSLSSGKYLAIAHRSGDGTIPQVRSGTSNNILTVGMSLTNPTSLSSNVTTDYENSAGKSEAFRYYRSRLNSSEFRSHSTNFTTINSTRPKNYFYFGLSDTESSFTETEIKALGNSNSTYDDTTDSAIVGETFNLGTFSDKYVVIAAPKDRYPSLTFRYTSAGTTLGFPTVTEDLDITNVVGFEEEYIIYRSQNKVGIDNLVLEVV